jgi:hypothetical protein
VTREFVVVFRAEIDGIDAVKALRAVANFGLKRFGLRVVAAREIAPGGGEPPRRIVAEDQINIVR